MAKSIYITATDTDIGKTFVSSVLICLLNKNKAHACYYKPIASGGIRQKEKVIPVDVEFVKPFLKMEMENDLLNSYSLEMAASPHLAAHVENVTIDVNVILDRYCYLMKKFDTVVVEGCGGIAVPLTKDGFMQADLIKKMGISCVLVTRTTLGTLNHTFTALSYAEKMGVSIKGILFNGYRKTLIDDDNIRTIEKFTGLKTLGILPFFDNVKNHESFREYVDYVEKYVNLDEIFNSI